MYFFIFFPSFYQTTSEDNIVVYFTDSHGRGSQFYPDRILTPDLTKKAMLIMKKHKLYTISITFSLFQIQDIFMVN